MLNLRNATEFDLPTIVEIYNASIGGRLATGDLDPISPESRLQWFHDHLPQTYPIWIVEKESQIAGWLSFQRFYGRAAYAKTAELSIYVLPDYQRQGVGQFLLQSAIAHAPELNLKTLLGFIFAHNHPSLKLFEKYEFERWGYLPKVAEIDCQEKDLVIMGRRVTSTKHD
jgi:L-amino acid N-acyltransferase YncA